MTLAAALLAVSLGLAALTLWLLFRYRAHLPRWPFRAWLALLAFFATLGGGIALTINRVWLLKVLIAAKQWSVVGDIARYDTWIIGAVLLATGFAITPRVFKLGSWLEVSGGQSAAEAADAVADAAANKADEIKTAVDDGTAKP